MFYRKELQKANQKEFRVGKLIKTKGHKLYFKRLWLNWWKDIVLVSEYFPELKSSGGRVKLDLDLSKYATKTDLRNPTGVDASTCARNGDLASLKSNVDKLDIDKLENVSSDLSSLESKAD